jgi:hypothetical protein
MTRTATALVGELNEFPGLTPLVPEGQPVALISWSFSEGEALPHRGPLPVRGGSLAGDLARASRNTRPPDYWLVVTDATGSTPLYWTPINGPDRVRVEVPAEDSEADWEVKIFPNPAQRLAVRVPFHPGALAALFPADGDAPIAPREILVFGDALPTTVEKERQP